jgi:hypothetical protein
VSTVDNKLIAPFAADHDAGLVILAANLVEEPAAASEETVVAAPAVSPAPGEGGLAISCGWL